MTPSHRILLRALPCMLLRFATCLFSARQRAPLNWTFRPRQSKPFDLMYSGKTDQAIALARKLEAERPDHPLGYLIEADVLWWNIYCKWSERKYNTIDAWSHTRPRRCAMTTRNSRWPTKSRSLAEAGIAKSDTAEMELYAGLGYASRARLLGLRYRENARGARRSRRPQAPAALPGARSQHG